MNDRILGYTVIGIVVLFLILPVGYLFWQASAPVATRTIAFKNVAGLSFLSVQDPVSIQGVVVGTIRDITIKRSTAFIEIETKDSLLLFEDYSINVVAKGVMGDRYLTIMPGNPQKKRVPTKTLLYGTVQVGPDEALSHVGELKDAVHTLMLLSERLKNGTAERKSLITQLWNFTTDTDSMIETLLKNIGALDTSLRVGIDSVQLMLENALVFTDTLSRVAPSATAALADAVKNLEAIVTKVDFLVVRADSLLAGLEDPEIIIWKKYSSSTTRNLSDLRELLREIQGGSLTLPVRLW